MPLSDSKHRLAFPKVKDLYGYVTVDGEPLEVYGVEENDRKAVAYIEAKEGKQFEVLVVDLRKDGQPRRTTSSMCTVDGKMNGPTFIDFDGADDHPSRVLAFSGLRVTETSIRPFLFNKLVTTVDEENACTDEKVVKALGSIQLLFHRVKRTRFGPVAPHLAKTTTQAPVHESNKKAALSHQAGAGAPVLQAVGETVDLDFLGGEESPFSTVEFRYRSRAILQFEDYIPASPAPEAVTSPSPQPAPVPAPASPPLRPVAGPSNPRRSSSSYSAAAAAASAAPSGSTSTSRSAADVARIVVEGGRYAKRIRQEEGEEVERRKEEDRKKGRKPVVIDLCDSD
ncbi:hypothetical protein JCM8547_007101 [Rhodosporidiobolus lusitaniae]